MTQHDPGDVLGYAMHALAITDTTHPIALGHDLLAELRTWGYDVTPLPAPAPHDDRFDPIHVCIRCGERDAEDESEWCGRCTVDALAPRP